MLSDINVCLLFHLLSCFRAKNQEVLTLAEQVDLYTEAVRAKDHVVMELTNKVTSLCSIAASVDCIY